MSDKVKLGDRVEITRYRSYDDEFVGLRGFVTQIDDDSTPYLVVTEEEGEVWAEDIKPLPTGDREALVTRAKELLAGE